MKKIFALILVFGVMLSFAACARDYSAPDGYQLASSTEHCDYVLYVPSAWNVENNQTNFTTASVPLGESRCTVSVAKLDARYEATTIDDYFQGCKGDYGYLTNFAVRTVETTDANGEKVESEGEQIVIGSGDKQRAGYRYIFSGNYGETSYTFQQVFTIKGSDIYCLTLTAVSAHYDTCAEAFNGILGYFYFK